MLNRNDDVTWLLVFDRVRFQGVLFYPFEDIFLLVLVRRFPSLVSAPSIIREMVEVVLLNAAANRVALGDRRVPDTLAMLLTRRSYHGSVCLVVY